MLAEGDGLLASSDIPHCLTWNTNQPFHHTMDSANLPFMTPFLSFSIPLFVHKHYLKYTITLLTSGCYLAMFYVICAL